MQVPSTTKRKKFQEEILTWYTKHKRDLPWRKDQEPYHILVSEVMLQQTQVPRVISKYQEWMETFPTLSSLSDASSSEVLLLWSGLGYNRRALYLLECAKQIMRDYKGIFPQDEKILLSLPGIGIYTASAIRCFSFDAQIACIDTNIRKIIAVKFFHGEVPDDKTLQEVATFLLPRGKAYTWNQALMDYASAEMKDKKILIPKQSPFQTSDRYFRGMIIRLLLAQQRSSKELLQEVRKVKHIEQDRYQKILTKLEKDGLIQSIGSIYKIPS